MSESKRIKTALVSVYHKEGLDEIITKLYEEGVEFLSTGGTRQFIESLGYPCKAVEDLTTYPSILGGRVKTLHPKIFGGILCRRDLEQDIQQMEKYEIPEIDLVIVDLYPFEATVASGASEADIIEKIDIGGISLIRAAAKNYNDVIIVASQAVSYTHLCNIIVCYYAKIEILIFTFNLPFFRQIVTKAIFHDVFESFILFAAILFCQVADPRQKVAMK